MHVIVLQIIMMITRFLKMYKNLKSQAAPHAVGKNDYISMRFMTNPKNAFSNPLFFNSCGDGLWRWVGCFTVF